jgi:glycosyltransferase involved in cell wall biosynthesis
MSVPFSICIPAYRAMPLLAETLESVARQTHAEWELIVVEDGSDDGTQTLVEGFANRVVQEVRYLRHPENRGLTRTRNTGFEAARYDWVAILDADDLWEPSHLSDLARLACGNSHDLIHAGSVLFDHHTGEELERRLPTPGANENPARALMIEGYRIQPSSAALRKDLWRRAGGFDPEFQHVEDLDMWLRCVRAGARLACTGSCTCRYRRHAESMSRSALAMALGVAAAFSKHADWDAIPAAERRSRLHQAWSDAGRLAFRASPADAVLCFRKALQHGFSAATVLRLMVARLATLRGRR